MPSDPVIKRIYVCEVVDVDLSPDQDGSLVVRMDAANAYLHARADELPEPLAVATSVLIAPPKTHALCAVDFSRVAPADARAEHEALKVAPGVLVDLPRLADAELDPARDNSAAEAAFGVSFAGTTRDVLTRVADVLMPDADQSVLLSWCEG